MEITKQYVLWNFLLFENYGEEVWGPIHCWSPNLRVGGSVYPSPYGWCAYVANTLQLYEGQVYATSSGRCRTCLSSTCWLTGRLSSCTSVDEPRRQSPPTRPCKDRRQPSSKSTSPSSATLGRFRPSAPSLRRQSAPSSCQKCLVNCTLALLRPRIGLSTCPDVVEMSANLTVVRKMPKNWSKFKKMPEKCHLVWKNGLLLTSHLGVIPVLSVY